MIIDNELCDTLYNAVQARSYVTINFSSEMGITVNVRGYSTTAQTLLLLVLEAIRQAKVTEHELGRHIQEVIPILGVYLYLGLILVAVARRSTTSAPFRP